jgi:hypothetical protein
VKKWMAAAGALDGEEQANGWMDGGCCLMFFLAWGCKSEAVEVCRRLRANPSPQPKQRFGEPKARACEKTGPKP